MIKKFFKNFNQNLVSGTLFKGLAGKLVAVVLLLSLFSCTDQGCIEADDFGEYEYQTLIINANGSGASCEFDRSLDLDDMGQGAGLQSYLTSGYSKVFDANGTARENDGVNGCMGFGSELFEELCIALAVQKCIVSNNANSGRSEPNWLATAKRDKSQNHGITLHPDAQITVKAVGAIILGDQLTYPSIYVSPVNHIGTYQDGNWNNKFFDVKDGQNLNVKFSGQWNNGSEDIGGGPNSITGTVAGRIVDQSIYNGARRTVMYAIPTPAGYNFNATIANDEDREEAGVKGVPLLPDVRAWSCSYPSSSSAECVTLNYKSLALPGAGYNNLPATSESFIKEVFPLSATERSPMLGHYGGMIRYDGDGLIADEHNPFDAGNPTSISQGGMLLEDASSGFSVLNGNPDSYKVSFKSNDPLCNITITAGIQNIDGIVLESYDESGAARYVPNNITLTDGFSSGYEMALEPNQRLFVGSISTLNSSSLNCGKSIQVKFSKYHDIQITQSGFVSFLMLNGTGVNECTISGNIINPNGSHLNYSHVINSVTHNYKADFYEYDPGAGNRPLASINVPSQVDINSTWTDEFFVRKGQVIRFSPESWNGAWLQSAGINVDCGIGMAMKITPRPALLCRGKASTEMDNPNCSQDYSTGELTGCLATSLDCYDDTSPSFCLADCQQPITCGEPGDDTNNFTKQNCNPGTAPATCVFDNPPTSTSSTQVKCDQCATDMLANVRKSPKISETVDQCYDLEAYEGKVSNIPSVEGFTADELSNSDIAKGAQELGGFNGRYGNFKSFTTTTEVDNNLNNVIYQSRSAVMFTKKSRLKFLLLDGDEFLNMKPTFYDDNNNPAQGTAYAGNNGFKIELSGMLQFQNGEMLAARLCSTDNGGVCVNSNPTALTPLLVEYGSAEPISTTPLDSGMRSSNYSFLNSGNLVRNTVPVRTDPPVDPPIPGEDCLETSSTSSFYCHTHATAVNQLKLAFKIIDPEITNCDIPAAGGSTERGIRLENPAYDVADANMDGLFCAYGEIPSTVVDPSETQCLKEFFCANKYANNSGKYIVTIKTKKPDGSNISNIIENVVNPVIEVMDGTRDGSKIGQAERIYKALIDDPRYQTILSICLVTMITFYGLGILMGVSEITHSELVSRVIKIGLIYLFVSPDGWYWFNEIVVGFFKDSTDYLAFMMASSFDNSSEIATAIATNDYYDKSILFKSVDKVFGMFFSDAVLKKVMALLFTSTFGFIYMWIIYLSFMLYVYAVCNAVLLYLTAQVFISILFILGPLFFIFTLFSQTKEMFDNWLKQLISFSLQQIFLLTTLAFFNMMMYEVIKMSLGYKICWDVVWSIKIIGHIDLMSFWTIPSVSSGANSQAGSISGQDGVPSLFSILFIWVIASLMNKFVTFMTDLAASIGGGLKASSLGAGVAGAVTDMQKFASDRSDKLYKRTVGHQIQRLDRHVFDSGKLAKKDRKARVAQSAKNAQYKGVLRDAGNEAVREYKKNNAASLSELSQEQQREKLEEIKTTGINDKGEAMGLKPAEIKKLRESKGSTYEGASLTGLAMHSAGQLWSKGGTMRKSIDDEGVNTKFGDKSSGSSVKSKRTDSDEERDKITKGFESGKLQTKRSTMGAIKKSAQRAYQNTKNSAGFGEAEKARQKLVDSGEIEDMAFGTRFAAKDEDKEKIEKEIVRNRREEKDRKTRTINPEAVAKVQQKAQDANVQQKAEHLRSESESAVGKEERREKMDEAKIVEARGDVGLSRTFEKRKQDKKAKAENVAKNVAKNYETKRGIQEGKIDKFEDKMDRAYGDDYSEKVESLLLTNKSDLTDKKEKLKALKGERGERKVSMRKAAIEKMTGGMFYKGKGAKRDEYNKDVKEKREEVAALSAERGSLKKISNYKGAEESMEAARTAYDEINKPMQEREKDIKGYKQAKKNKYSSFGSKIGGAVASVAIAATGGVERRGAKFSSGILTSISKTVALSKIKKNRMRKDEWKESDVRDKLNEAKDNKSAERGGFMDMAKSFFTTGSSRTGDRKDAHDYRGIKPGGGAKKTAEKYNKFNDDEDS